MKLITFVLALLALICVFTTASALVAPQPTDESALQANMNRFIVSKNTVEAKPYPTTWLSVQYDVKITNTLQQWFLQFNKPDYFYSFDLTVLFYQSSRGYFTTPSAPNTVYVYEVQPQSKSVVGNGIVFNNFKYFYCGTTTLSEYQSLTNEQDHLNLQTGETCQEVGPINWNSGYFLSYWTWYKTETAYYTQNAPAYILAANPDVVYGGFNQDSQYFYSYAYGRSSLYPIMAKASPAIPIETTRRFGNVEDHVQGYAKTNITFSIYPTYNAVWGWTIPYDREVFSIRSITTPPVCVFTRMSDGYQWAQTFYKYSKDNVYFTEMPAGHTGFHLNCQVTVVTQAQQGSLNFAWVPIRYHDIIGSTFSFELPSTSAERARAQADPWADYQQDVIEVAWT